MSAVLFDFTGSGRGGRAGGHDTFQFASRGVPVDSESEFEMYAQGPSLEDLWNSASSKESKYGVGGGSGGRARSSGGQPSRKRQRTEDSGVTGGGYDAWDAEDGDDNMGLGSLDAIAGRVPRSIVERSTKVMVVDRNMSFGLNREQRRPGHVLMGRGVTAPTQRQSQIVQTIKLPKTQWEDRGNVPLDRQLVPVGKDTAFKAIPHQIYLVRVKDESMGTSRKLGVSEVPQLHTGTESCILVNGMDVHSKWAVGGITQTARDQSNSKSDDLSAGVLMGSESTTHEGWGRIYPGARVMVSYTPYTTFSKKGLIPAIMQPGRDETAFVPATYVADPLEPVAAAANFRAKLDVVFDAAITGAQIPGRAFDGKADVADLFAKLSDAIEKYRNESDMKQSGDQLPIYTYGNWYAIGRLFQFPFFMAMFLEARPFATALNKFLADTITHSDKNRYIELRNTFIPGGMIDREGRDVLHNMITLLQNWAKNGVSTVDLAASSSVISEFLKYVEAQKDHTLACQFQYILTHTLGTATNFADSSQQLDLILHPGY